MQFSINADHPALSGHFPGNPIVPGVMITDQVLAATANMFPTHRIIGIRKLKFLRPLLPDQTCDVQLGGVRAGRLRFECLQADQRIAEGNLLLEDDSEFVV